MAGAFGGLLFTRIAPDAILCASVGLLLLTGVLTPAEALAGMSNEGMMTVAIFFIVANALTRAGVVAWASDIILGRPRNRISALTRLMLPVAGMSSVLNNTPVVAMLVPAVANWAKRFQIPASQLMMPLSYAAIVGGTCTLVGTSTNLIVNGMMLDYNASAGFGLFELAWIGIPVVLITLVYTLLLGSKLLPNRQGALTRFENARQYIVEMHLDPDSPLVGKNIEEAGLRHLQGVYLVEIKRGDNLITAVAPTERLVADDHLIFAGDVESVVDIHNLRGLRPAEQQVFKLDADRSSRCLVEAVISDRFQDSRKTVKELNFRKRYSAAIIAVSRAGEQIKQKIGDVVLQAGDTVLLETYEGFAQQQQYSRDFLLVSTIENSKPVLHEKRFLAVGILLVMIACVSAGFISLFKAAVAAAGAMIITRCITVHDARKSLDWQVLIVIAASIALGNAVRATGIADQIALSLINAVDGTPLGVLAIIFFLTALFSAIISNVAAAVLMFPIVLSTCQALGVDIQPFMITLMIAASCSFATPIGYQTNLMVFGPGDYHSMDFLKMGGPLTLLIGLVTVFLVPLIWSF